MTTSLINSPYHRRSIYRKNFKPSFEYIETFYNTVRIHSHCDYMSPNEFEELYERVMVAPAA